MSFPSDDDERRRCAGGKEVILKWTSERKKERQTVGQRVDRENQGRNKVRHFSVALSSSGCLSGISLRVRIKERASACFPCRVSFHKSVCVCVCVCAPEFRYNGKSKGVV